MKVKDLGHSMQETLYYKNGIFHAQELRYITIEGKNNDK